MHDEAGVREGCITLVGPRAPLPVFSLRPRTQSFFSTGAGAGATGPGEGAALSADPPSPPFPPLPPRPPRAPALESPRPPRPLPPRPRVEPDQSALFEPVAPLTGPLTMNVGSASCVFSETPRIWREEQAASAASSAA